MTRTEIVEEAKQTVLSSGPANVLEFGLETIGVAVIQNGEYVRNMTDVERQAVLAEATKQAHRVYKFLGYRAPWA